MKRMPVETGHWIYNVSVDCKKGSVCFPKVSTELVFQDSRTVFRTLNLEPFYDQLNNKTNLRFAVMLFKRGFAQFHYFGIPLPIRRTTRMRPPSALCDSIFFSESVSLIPFFRLIRKIIGSLNPLAQGISP